MNTLGQVPSMAQMVFPTFMPEWHPTGSPLFPAATPYCLPAHPCYPSPDVFASFNHSIGGRLVRPEVPDFNCHDANCLSATWRGEQPGGQMFVNFESGWGLPNLGSDASPTAEPVVAAPSPRGRTAEYVVQVAEPGDIVKAVAFAARHHLRLRVKNTGHDYLGRSSDEGSFTIWTHYLKQTSFNPHFIPHGADRTFVPIPGLVAGAGVQVGELYEAADRAGVLVAGGVSNTVGAMGGFLLGGGHGPLAPLLGLAVDNVLEFTVVTASGSIVKASAFSNPTLFTALRGGGGPAFGIVVEAVVKAHTPPPGFIGVFGTLAVSTEAKDKEAAWKDLLREWVAAQSGLSAAGFAGYSYLRKQAYTPVAYVLPSANYSHAEEAFAPFLDYANSHADVNFTVSFVQEDHWYDLWKGEFTNALHSLDEVGINLLLGGRLIPRAVVEDESRANALADFLSSAASPSIVHLVAGGAVSNHPPSLPPSINPLWRESLLHIDLPVAWSNATSPTEVAALEKYLTSHTLALGEVARFADGSQAAYPSEGDYNEEKWQETWYGNQSYATLVEAKKEWDPTGVFSARRAPASEYFGY